MADEIELSYLVRKTLKVTQDQLRELFRNALDHWEDLEKISPTEVIYQAARDGLIDEEDQESIDISDDDFELRATYGGQEEWDMDDLNSWLLEG